MSNQIVEGLFLLAFWAPPLTVLACALLLLAPDSSSRRLPAPHRHATLTH
jgi:hypothetical protein